VGSGRKPGAHTNNQSKSARMQAFLYALIDSVGAEQIQYLDLDGDPPSYCRNGYPYESDTPEMACPSLKPMFEEAKKWEMDHRRGEYLPRHWNTLADLSRPCLKCSQFCVISALFEGRTKTGEAKLTYRS
jgi:hypothetical protein